MSFLNNFSRLHVVDEAEYTRQILTHVKLHHIVEHFRLHSTAFRLP